VRSVRGPARLQQEGEARVTEGHVVVRGRPAALLLRQLRDHAPQRGQAGIDCGRLAQLRADRTARAHALRACARRETARARAAPAALPAAAAAAAPSPERSGRRGWCSGRQSGACRRANAWDTCDPGPCWRPARACWRAAAEPPAGLLLALAAGSRVMWGSTVSEAGGARRQAAVPTRLHTNALGPSVTAPVGWALRRRRLGAPRTGQVHQVQARRAHARQAALLQPHALHLRAPPRAWA